MDPSRLLLTPGCRRELGCYGAGVRALAARECAPHDAPGSDDFLATDDCQRRTAQRGPDDGNDDHDNDDRCAAGPEKEPFGLSPGLFKKFVRDVWGWLFGW